MYVLILLMVEKCDHFIGSNYPKIFSLAGQHVDNISSSHGKGKKTKSEFESKVSAAEKGADEQKSALNASENLKREVSSADSCSVHKGAPCPLLGYHHC